jgi:hypothetical protein
MNLQIVPARQGVVWVRMGILTFFKQPLALAGLFFMFMASMSLLSLVPLIGNVLALVLLPGATLGLMAATLEAAQGRFPRPSVLISAFRAKPESVRAMLTLGAMYAAGFVLVLTLSALADGGKFARLYLFGGGLSPELLQSSEFMLALILAMVFYTPLSLLFWHAPALVHWHGVSPAKSLFFSLVACMRNFWAFTLFSLVWFGVFLGMGMAVTLVAVLLDNPEVVGLLMFPGSMLLAAMFFTSIYFTFQDCFAISGGDIT